MINIQSSSEDVSIDWRSMKQPSPTGAPTMTSTLATRSIYPLKMSPLVIPKETHFTHPSKQKINQTINISEQNALQHNLLLNIHLLQ
jgi:hypothetical protein